MLTNPLFLPILHDTPAMRKDMADGEWPSIGDYVVKPAAFYRIDAITHYICDDETLKYSEVTSGGATVICQLSPKEVADKWTAHLKKEQVAAC